MSCLECCFKCLVGMGCRECVLKTVAFYPPNPKGYDIKDRDTDPNSKIKSPLNTMSLTDGRGMSYLPRDIEGITSKIYWLTTERNQTIPALYFHNNSCKNNFVILYSHGNSTDIGKMRDLLQDLSYTLNVHVFAYEYTGYGQSTGKPSDLNMICDVSAAYCFLIERLGFKWNNIVMYGRSIGSGPSLYVASYPAFKVAGVILHSPISSGLRLINAELKKTPSYDLFPNIDMMPHVKCPVFIIHGQSDQEVPILHGKILVSRCKNFYEPWWCEHGGHNDIDIRFRKHYFIRIAKFLKFLTEYFSKKKPKELEALHKVEDWISTSDHIYYKKSRATSAGKYQEKSTKHIETTSSFASGTSSSFISHNTTTTKTDKPQAESIMTGAETTRKLGTETARSMLDYNDEEKKNDKKNSIQRNTTIELEISYTDRTLARQITDDVRKRSDLLIHVEELNLAKIDESDSDRPNDLDKKLKTQTKETHFNDTSFDKNPRIMLDEIVTEMDDK